MPVLKLDDERNRVQRGQAKLTHPSFLPGPALAVTNPAAWSKALADLSTMAVEISCLPDVEYLHELIVIKLPGVLGVIKRVAIPSMLWFSGATASHDMNPYLNVLHSLPALHEVALGFHAGGFTQTIHSERVRIDMKRKGELQASKTLKVKPTSDIIRYYCLHKVLELNTIRNINLHVMNSALVQEHTRHGDPLRPIEDIRGFLVKGFARRGQQVSISVFNNLVNAG